MIRYPGTVTQLASFHVPRHGTHTLVAARTSQTLAVYHHFQTDRKMPVSPREAPPPRIVRVGGDDLKLEAWTSSDTVQEGHLTVFLMEQTVIHMWSLDLSTSKAIWVHQQTWALPPYMHRHGLHLCYHAQQLFVFLPDTACFFTITEPQPTWVEMILDQSSPSLQASEHAVTTGSHTHGVLALHDGQYDQTAGCVTLYKFQRFHANGWCRRFMKMQSGRASGFGHKCILKHNRLFISAPFHDRSGVVFVYRIQDNLRLETLSELSEHTQTKFGLNMAVDPLGRWLAVLGTSLTPAITLWSLADYPDRSRRDTFQYKGFHALPSSVWPQAVRLAVDEAGVVTFAYGTEVGTFRHVPEVRARDFSPRRHQPSPRHHSPHKSRRKHWRPR